MIDDVRLEEFGVGDVRERAARRLGSDRHRRLRSLGVGDLRQRDHDRTLLGPLDVDVDLLARELDLIEQAAQEGLDLRLVDIIWFRVALAEDLPVSMLAG